MWWFANIIRSYPSVPWKFCSLQSLRICVRAVDVSIRGLWFSMPKSGGICGSMQLKSVVYLYIYNGFSILVWIHLECTLEAVALQFSDSADVRDMLSVNTPKLFQSLYAQWLYCLYALRSCYLLLNSFKSLVILVAQWCNCFHSVGKWIWREAGPLVISGFIFFWPIELYCIGKVYLAQPK